MTLRELDELVDSILSSLLDKYGDKFSVSDWLYVGNSLRDKIFIMLLPYMIINSTIPYTKEESKGRSEVNVYR